MVAGTGAPHRGCRGGDPAKEAVHPLNLADAPRRRAVLALTIIAVLAGLRHEANQAARRT
jgi:hypothetical protein